MSPQSTLFLLADFFNTPAHECDPGIWVEMPFFGCSDLPNLSLLCEQIRLNIREGFEL